MSKHETPMTEAFWEKYAGGAYIPKYCIVRAIKGHCSVRRLDALILPDEPHGRHGRRTLKGKGYDKLAGRNVIVIARRASVSAASSAGPQSE
jgi:hypothetical protein